MSSERVLRVFVDRFEDDLAVLLIGDDCWQVVIPRILLPSDAGEGSALTIILRYEAAETACAREEVKRAIDDLGQP